MLFDVHDEVEHENLAERIQESGLGAELVRASELERFKAHIAAFCSHARVAELAAMNRVFEYREQLLGSNGSAPIVDAFFALYGVYGGRP